MDKLKKMKREGKEIAARAKNPANVKEGRLIAAQAEHELGEIRDKAWIKNPAKAKGKKKRR